MTLDAHREHTEPQSADAQTRARPRGAADGETLALLDALFEHLPAMVFLKRASDLTFVRFNRAGEELIGLPRESPRRTIGLRLLPA